LIRKIIIWIAVTSFLLGLALFVLVYQEYKPVHSSELIMESVRSPNLVGDFIYPSKESKLPVVVFLGGSGGGMGNETEMKSLALEGYAVFSLAYFKAAGLPEKLENIPLEYFENAFAWLNTRSQVDTSKIILLGVSRGAELALLLGSVYPQVKGVIAYSPSCFVLPNATEVEKETSLTASWTVKGNPVPFVAIKRFDENGDKPINYRTYIEPLLSQNNPFEEFMIKAENINGPVLLISGAQDAVWPASEMAGRIEDRLKKKGFKHELNNTIFEDGGHDVFMMKDCVPVVSGIAFKRIRLTIRGEQYSFNLGGTTMGVIDSKIESRKIALHFLEAFKSAN
jgi:dienelactone hydrolase